MKEWIKKKAVEIGFSLCGITTTEPVDGLPHLERAIVEGRTAGMDYLARDPIARCDPRSLMPEARSVICCATAYRFSRGADYHAEVRSRLAKLWDSIKVRHPSARAKLCCDTSPILEKALAQRAGLGWIGKHTVLVNRNLGSWFVLGEIITDLEIEPDTPHEDLCGDCSKCIDACPANSIVSPHKLDARKCISYLTIEAPRLEIGIRDQGPGTGKGGPDPGSPIPGPEFGCDLCQEACPYNLHNLP